MTETTVTTTANDGPTKASRSQWSEVWRQFRSHRGALMGGGFLVFVTLFVLLGPYIWPFEPRKLDIRAKDMRPIYTLLWLDAPKVSWWHPLGTDNLGRDLLARLIEGGRISMSVGWAAMLLSLFLGGLIGVVSGYFRALDGALMRLTDLFLSLPLLPLVLVAATLYGPALSAQFGSVAGTFVLVVVVIGITNWMPTARIVRGDILALKEREFILAARSIGTRPFKIITRHLLPNVLSPIMVSATLGLATAIITESAVSFLGLGFPPDFPSWGKLLADNTDRMVTYPERVIWPGLMISLTVLAVNYIGDGLRDALDPRIRGR
ncbi:ABC transporter permease [Vannielia sp.]|uniref:ABC transporter permease n=1 Tax=Vannielia sp. TaxID=2813045 RepID=UPI002623B21E|nr:ABC transporter permease [Vannielia sp.]MDF1873042.1 ABC transporter permease [Vannielia sp.]